MRIGHLWYVGGKRESGPSVDVIRHLRSARDNMIVPKLELDVCHLHGIRRLL